MYRTRDCSLMLCIQTYTEGATCNLPANQSRGGERAPTSSMLQRVNVRNNIPRDVHLPQMCIFFHKKSFFCFCLFVVTVIKQMITDA